MKYRKGWRLTLEQINTARILRFEQRWTWRRIAAQFKCSCEPIQRAIDPKYDLYKRERYQLRKEELQRIRVEERIKSGKIGRPRGPAVKNPLPDSDEAIFRTRRALLKADKSFCDAMALAIRTGQESASIGVDRQPSSPDARYHPMRGMQNFSVTGSPAGMCADT